MTTRHTHRRCLRLRTGALAFALLALLSGGCKHKKEDVQPVDVRHEVVDWRERYPNLALEESVWKEKEVDRRWNQLLQADPFTGTLQAPLSNPEFVRWIARISRGKVRCTPNESWGRFDELPKFEGQTDWRRGTYLERDFRFDDERTHGKPIAPPRAKGTDDDWAWNGASIPRPLRWALGQPKGGCYALASIHHDYYYQTTREDKPKRSWVDRLFYRGMRANGVSRWKAWSFYWAVRAFGRGPYVEVGPHAPSESQRTASDETFYRAWYEVSLLCYLVANNGALSDEEMLDRLDALSIADLYDGYAISH